jgi:enoyl-CoA hydratase/carnithine racemase
MNCLLTDVSKISGGWAKFSQCFDRRCKLFMTESINFGRLAYVTLNRPEAMNAIDLPMHDALWQIWSEFQADDGLDIAVVTGAKGQHPDTDEAFCAGADLKTHVPK